MEASGATVLNVADVLRSTGPVRDQPYPMGVFYEYAARTLESLLWESCLSMKLSKAAETQRMSHRGFQSLCHIRVRTVQLPPTSL